MSEDTKNDLEKEKQEATAEAAAEETAGQEAAAEATAAEAAAEETPDLETQLAEAQGNYLRALAELENYRKRMAREMQEARLSTRCQTIQDVLGIYDLLQMAVDHAQKSTDMDAMRQGLDMTFGEFKRLLDSLGVTIIDARDQQFDPQVHDALSTMPSDTVPEGVVLQQWKPGFKLGDRLIRTASVVVSSGPAAPAESDESAAAPAGGES